MLAVGLASILLPAFCASQHPMKPKVTAYATFSGDEHYHLVNSAGGYNRTLCDLSTKGSLRNIRQYRRPARVTTEIPPPTHAPCPLCHAARAREMNEPLRLVS